MRIVATKTLLDFWLAHPDAKTSLQHWISIARASAWRSMNDVMLSFPKAKAINGERARFEVAGGNYRPIAAFQFGAQIVWVKFIGTHADYDKIDAANVSQF
jgi:mRNA interferase HigB